MAIIIDIFNICYEMTMELYKELNGVSSILCTCLLHCSRNTASPAENIATAATISTISRVLHIIFFKYLLVYVLERNNSGLYTRYI